MHPSLLWLIPLKLQACLNIFTQYGLGQIGSMVWGGAIMTSNKECNHSMSFAIVDQELWLLYMYNSALSPQHLVNQPQPLKCYNFKYRGACSRQNCLYSHLCILCSQPHPYTMCRNTTRNSLNFRYGNFQSTWRPQSTVKSATNSNRTPPSLAC